MGPSGLLGFGLIDDHWNAVGRAFPFNPSHSREADMFGCATCGRASTYRKKVWDARRNDYNNYHFCSEVCELTKIEQLDIQAFTFKLVQA